MALIEAWLAQLAALVSAAMATAAATAAVSTWLLVRRHDRTLYGEEAIESDRGLVNQVNENRHRSRRNRRALAHSDAIEEVVEDG